MFTVKVIPHAKKNEIVERADGFLKVKLTAAPENGKANKALLRLLAQEFNVPLSHVSIIRGERARLKYIGILSSCRV